MAWRRERTSRPSTRSGCGHSTHRYCAHADPLGLGALSARNRANGTPLHGKRLLVRHRSTVAQDDLTLSSSSVHGFTFRPRAMRAMLSMETLRSDRSTPLALVGQRFLAETTLRPE